MKGRKLKPISRILFDRQIKVVDGEKIVCHSLAQMLVVLTVALGFLAAMGLLIAIGIYMMSVLM